MDMSVVGKGISANPDTAGDNTEVPLTPCSNSWVTLGAWPYPVCSNLSLPSRQIEEGKGTIPLLHLWRGIAAANWSVKQLIQYVGALHQHSGNVG